MEPPKCPTAAPKPKVTLTMTIETDQHWPVSRRRFLETAGAAVCFTAGANAGTTAAKAGETVFGGETYEPLDPDKKVRVGIAGGGFGSTFQFHLDPNCIVHAVSDLREDRREKLKRTYRCDLAYDSLEELISDPAIDAVAIFTPVPDHTCHASAAMEAGKHVMSAIPACMTLEEAEQLVEVKKRTGLRYMMAETSYFYLPAIAARELYQQGAFGRLFYTECEYSHPLPDQLRQQHWYYQGKRTWRYGFPPMHYPSHAISHLVGVTKERLTHVSSCGVLAPKIEGYGVGKNRYDNPFNAEMAMFRTDQGNVCRANVIWTGTNAGSRAQWFGTRMSFFMPGRRSGQPLKMIGPGAPEWDELPDYRHRLPESMRDPQGEGGSHPFLTHEFIAALVEDREPLIEVYEALAMTVPGIVAHQSSLRGGEQLVVPSFDPSSS